MFSFDKTRAPPATCVDVELFCYFGVVGKIEAGSLLIACEIYAGTGVCIRRGIYIYICLEGLDMQASG